MDIYEKYTRLEDLPVATLLKKPKTSKSLRGVIHILHGMCEHKERYKSMLDFFCEKGFICVISDIRGHGENVLYNKDLGYIGENGEETLVEDVYAVNVFIHNTFPDLPVIIVAHSFGSLIARAFLKKYDDCVDFVFLAGAPSNTLNKYVGFLLTELQALVFDDKEKTKLVDFCMYDKFNKQYKDEGKNSWLCSDRDIIEKYNNDEKCNFTFSINGYNILFRLMIKVYSKRKWSLKNKQLPIFFIVGSEDVFVGGKEKLGKQLKFLKSVGYERVRYHIFKGMRHEIFNEPDHMKVFEYMISKLEKYNI